MTAHKTVTTSANLPIFQLCNACEERFLRDLLGRSHKAVADARQPEAHVLFDAIEEFLGWPGTKSPVQVPAILLYWVAIYARYENVREQHRCDPSHACYAHDVGEILKHFMRTVETLIHERRLVRHTDDGSSLICLKSRYGSMRM
jgi:hypothetical protein